MKSLKALGRKLELPPEQGGWKFSRRPGGWIIAERAGANGAGERFRLALTASGARVYANGPWGALHGELVTGIAHGAASGGGDSDLIAQFPGKVRKVLVKKGERVAEGDRLVLVEAMKMEFAVKAPYAGTVTGVRVADGQQIGPGDRLVDLESEEKDE